ncbi:MAG: putative rane-associated regulator with a motif [Anaerocolumna sp.]|nr:putative rane-associated regulator with a motif [Anaerocolumna sp.]
MIFHKIRDRKRKIDYTALMVNEVFIGGLCMEEKLKFANFITQKRKESNLTQKEFAEKLYVSDTAVSKWERGLSYPDITLITHICKILNITEHEFFMACDDLNAKIEKNQAKKYRYFMTSTKMSLYFLYGAAIITCFICNLSINHTLSWFWIVLCSISLAFSITHLPFLLKRNQIIITFATASILVYMLEFIICMYVSGDWLFQVAYPITTVSLAWVWIIMLIIKYLKVSVIIKSSIITLIAGVIIITMNPVCGYFLGEDMATIISYMDLTQWKNDNMGNKIAFLCFIIIGLVGLFYGIVIRQKIKENTVTD